jgi:hypothetical protein
MPPSRTSHARAVTGVASRVTVSPRTVPQQIDLQIVAQHLFSLMLRNVAQANRSSNPHLPIPGHTGAGLFSGPRIPP